MAGSLITQILQSVDSGIGFHDSNSVRGPFLSGRIDLRHDWFHSVRSSGPVSVVAVESPHIRLTPPDSIHAVDGGGSTDAANFW